MTSTRSRPTTRTAAPSRSTWASMPPTSRRPRKAVLAELAQAARRGCARRRAGAGPQLRPRAASSCASRNRAPWPSFLGSQEALHDRVLTMDEVMDEMRAVTAEDVQALAGRLFRDEVLCAAVIGPRQAAQGFEDAAETAVSDERMPGQPPARVPPPGPPSHRPASLSAHPGGAIRGPGRRRARRRPMPWAAPPSPGGPARRPRPPAPGHSRAIAARRAVRGPGPAARGARRLPRACPSGPCRGPALAAAPGVPGPGAPPRPWCRVRPGPGLAPADRAIPDAACSRRGARRHGRPAPCCPPASALLPAGARCPADPGPGRRAAAHGRRTSGPTASSRRPAASRARRTRADGRRWHPRPRRHGRPGRGSLAQRRPRGRGRCRPCPPGLRWRRAAGGPRSSPRSSCAPGSADEARPLRRLRGRHGSVAPSTSSSRTSRAAPLWPAAGRGWMASEALPRRATSACSWGAARWLRRRRRPGRPRRWRHDGTRRQDRRGRRAHGRADRAQAGRPHSRGQTTTDAVVMSGRLAGEELERVDRALAGGDVAAPRVDASRSCCASTRRSLRSSCRAPTAPWRPRHRSRSPACLRCISCVATPIRILGRENEAAAAYRQPTRP